MMEYPKLNKALRFTTIGDLQAIEAEVTPLPPTEVLVKVHAASMNPVDIQLWRSGLVGVVAGEKAMGRDFSGVVVPVGSKVTEWKEGDDIFELLFQAFGQGTLSQYINIDPLSVPVARKPTSSTHEQAASVPLVALTAFACLDWLPAPLISQRVIVRGASGGTASWIVQLAKTVYNCHVTAICSTKNSNYVSGLGANEVIDYTSEDVVSALSSRHATAKRDHDLLVDCVGGTELLLTYPQILNRKGAYVTIVGDKADVKRMGGPITYFTSPSQVIRFIKGWIWGPRYACVSFYSISTYLEQVTKLSERGEVKAEVQEVIEGASDEREGWRKAVQLIEGGRVRGKVILAIS